MKKNSKFLFYILLFPLLLTGCASQRGYISYRGGLDYSDIAKLGGAEYVKLNAFAAKYGVAYSIDRVSNVVEINHGRNSVKILPESNVSLINGSVKKFAPETKLSDNQIYMAPALAEYILKYVVKKRSERSYAQPSREELRGRMKIVIDPGHGGKDPGAIGAFGIREKTIVLDIAKRLRDELNKRGGFDVIMTRDSDEFITLEKRADIANRTNADALISIHANSSRKRAAHGFEVYYLSNTADDTSRALNAAKKDGSLSKGAAGGSQTLNATLWDMKLNDDRTASKELASSICTSSSSGLCISNRGVKAARFYVLKGTNVPSVLIEVGFLSNRYEAKNLNDPLYRQKIAESIADGIVGFANKFK